MTGETLKKRREDLGLNIGEIAAELKIKTDYLKAIENNAFERLPVEVYTKGYIRCYARYLDVDPEPIIQYYSNHLSQPKPSTIIPIASSKKKSPMMLYVISVILAASVVFLVFHNLSKDSGNKPQSNLNKAPVTKPVHTEIANPSEIKQSIPESREHNVDIKAINTTWINIKFENGGSEEILLLPGQAKNWKFSQNATLKIGNAGGVTLSFNGKDIGIPGKSGQVITLNFPDR